MGLGTSPDITIFLFSFDFLISGIADINIFGMQENPHLGNMREMAKKIGTSVLFLRDSKHESALA